MSRKYHHQGYQDADRERDRDRDRDRGAPSAPPRRELTQEERIQRRSLKHAIDREANEVLRCHACGRSLFDIGAVGTQSTCPHCQAALHCCRTCRHFDSASRWQCRAEIVEAVTDKTKANTCPRYEPRLVLDTTGRRASATGGNGTSRGPQDPRAQFENLFRR